VISSEPLPAGFSAAIDAARPRFGGHVAAVHYAASVPSTMDWAAALADDGLEASLKWPNDLFYGYKLAGVLAEGHGVGQPGQFVVVGVGINVRDVTYLSDSEVRTTSLERELGRAPEAGVIAAEVLAAWAQRYQDLLDGRFTRVVERWRVRASGLVGRPVAWTDADGEHEGTTTGVDATGALLVDTGLDIVRISAGPVQWQ
jgi:biotin-[acetyl-CoA-carboxylase] ligase BirA-like protein